MRTRNPLHFFMIAVGLTLGVGSLTAKPKPTDAQSVPFTASGQKLEARYTATLKELVTDISKVLPAVDETKKTSFKKAHEAVAKMENEAGAAQNNQSTISSAKALVEHAKGKWIGGAEKGIAKAQADLKKATTDAERESAKKDLAQWQANKLDGLKALKERQAAYDKAKTDEAKFSAASTTAKAALAKAKEQEMAAFQSLIGGFAPVLSTDKFDTKLVKAMVIADANPHGLAEFAQESAEKEALVDKILADDKLMKEMLAAGGAKFGKYGHAVEIYAAIRKASSKASDGFLQSLALATSLEHAKPITQSNPKDDTTSPTTIDPVKRYLHYEKAFLAGELDPAFKELNTWELRMVVDCDAPDQILSWGREMLRNYRPDHIYTSNYGWRYAATVKTEVPYGSQNVKCDLESLHNYQNIIKDGGICGRRAFFGRFILSCFGIPTWGVTQHAHAALSHWTPKGWVVNLGAGFEHSWWDKDEVPMSGIQFLNETQAREHSTEFMKVLRARWISKILGEQAFNDRKKIEGGFWSNIAHFQAIALASQAVTLGPLGQELAEANEPEDTQKADSTPVSAGDLQITSKNGSINIPAVAHGKTTGKSLTMKSYSGGMQMHALGGFKTDYTLDAPRAGDYLLSAQVVTAQEGQIFIFGTSASKQLIEAPVPYTIGMWKETDPVKVSLEQGKNTLQFELKEGSRGVTIKGFTLTPVR